MTPKAVLIIAAGAFLLYYRFAFAWTPFWIDWHKSRPGMLGWRGKDHWHHNGGEDHLPPGTEVPDPVTPPPPASRDACGENCKRVLKSVRDAVTGAIIFTIVLVCASS